MLAGQNLLDYIGENLKVEYEVISNVSTVCKSKVTFTNAGDQVIPGDEWSIYLYHMCQIASESLAFNIEHVVGGLFKVTASEDFRKLKPGDKIELPLSADDPTASRSSVFPNWYVAQLGLQPRIIKSTADESLSFVKAFDTSKKWKKNKMDKWDPLTPEQRYEKYTIEDLGKPGTPVIPTPFSCKLNKGTAIDLSKGKWAIKNEHEIFKNEAEILAKHLGIELFTIGESEKDIHCINLKVGDVENPYSSTEAYKIELDSNKLDVVITANTSAGMFYGIQTILSLVEDSSDQDKHRLLPGGVIVDAPRFPYRGFHIDVSRNFVKADEIMKIIRVMSTYKMNKFQFHLTDDEGWRLEIKDIPELTKVGAVRDHDLASKGLAVEPTLGSGPSGSGCDFYTVEDYKNILKCARDHHVEVIPEIDMPGHCYAAVVAMTARYNRFKEAGDMDAAVEYMLTDADGESMYASVQKYTDNTINPCLEGTKRFVKKIISTLKSLHEPIQPLKMFHVGADEVPSGAWDSSEECQKCYKESDIDGTDPFFNPDEQDDEDEVESQKMTSAIQEYFIRFVEKVCRDENLQLGIWNDGIHDPTSKQTSDNQKLVHAWRISRTNERHNPNILANSGYQVVICSATHTYFDHPYEPDPEESGLHWCVRMMDTISVFGMKPYDMYACQDERFNKIDHEKLKNKSAIVGIQSQIWGELIRTKEKLEHMLFPRVLAIAERAWHEAEWEKDGKGCSESQDKDWASFANTVRYKELQRLENMDVYYRIPPPGLLIKEDKLYVASVYPNLTYKFRKSGAEKWENVTASHVAKDFKNGEYEFVTTSLDGARFSRIITMKF